MADYATILAEQRGEIGLLTLNLPETLNAVTPLMAEELGHYFESLQARPDIRVVILKGAGREFCAGAALGSEAFAKPGPGRAHRQLAMQRLYSRLPRVMRACPQPIIALLQGAACGAGFSLVLAADVRFCTERARMNAAYLRVGVGGCDMGSGYFLPRLVGSSLAAELLLTGNFIGAVRAKQTGLVSDVVADETLLETGLKMAGDMLKASPLALRLTKETLNNALDAQSLDAALMAEDRQQVLLLETGDHREAVTAFRERRPPNYRDE